MAIVHISGSVGGESYFSYVKVMKRKLEPHLTLNFLEDIVASLERLESKLFIAQFLVYLKGKLLLMILRSQQYSSNMR